MTYTLKDNSDVPASSLGRSHTTERKRTRKTSGTERAKGHGAGEYKKQVRRKWAPLGQTKRTGLTSGECALCTHAALALQLHFTIQRTASPCELQEPV